MKNVAVTMILNQLKSQNPQAYQILIKASKGEVSLDDIVQSSLGNFTPEQLEDLYARSRKLGISDEAINQVQDILKVVSTRN